MWTRQCRVLTVSPLWGAVATVALLRVNASPVELLEVIDGGLLAAELPFEETEGANNQALRVKSTVQGHRRGVLKGAMSPAIATALSLLLAYLILVCFRSLTQNNLHGRRLTRKRRGGFKNVCGGDGESEENDPGGRKSPSSSTTTPCPAAGCNSPSACQRRGLRVVCGSRTGLRRRAGAQASTTTRLRSNLLVWYLICVTTFVVVALSMALVASLLRLGTFICASPVAVGLVLLLLILYFSPRG